MRTHKLLVVIAITVLLAACKSVEPTASEPVEEQEGVVQLDPQLPTGVHLQAAFELPETLEGMPITHDELRYLVYLPDGYGDDPEREWPMIFFLPLSYERAI